MLTGCTLIVAVAETLGSTADGLSTEAVSIKSCPVGGGGRRQREERKRQAEDDCAHCLPGIHHELIGLKYLRFLPPDKRCPWQRKEFRRQITHEECYTTNWNSGTHPESETRLGPHANRPDAQS